MPDTAFWSTVALSAAAAWANGTKALGLLNRGTLGRQTWHLWGDVTGLVGLASLPQVRRLSRSLLLQGPYTMYRHAACRCNEWGSTLGLRCATLRKPLLLSRPCG